MESAFNKLASLLPKEATLGRLEALRALFISSPKSVKDLTGAGPIIEDLTFAVIRGSHARSATTPIATTRQRPSPSILCTSSNGAAACICWWAERDRRKSRLSPSNGFAASAPTSEAFKYPEGFDVDQYLDSVLDVVDGEPVRVAIRFSADQARYIRERRWSQRQSIKELPDGSIILRMTVLGLWDVTRWVLSYGPSAQVISPAVLRRRVEEQAREIVSLYKQ